MINCESCGRFISHDWSNLLYKCDTCKKKPRESQSFYDEVEKGLDDIKNGRVFKINIDKL